MSIKSQQANMKTIHSLVAKDLGYIGGERESGPNGDKKIFLTKSAAFLRALGNDLGLGTYFQLNQPAQPFSGFLYRSISRMKDYSGRGNHWLPCYLFEHGDYERLIGVLSELRMVALQEETAEVVQIAA